MNDRKWKCPALQEGSSAFAFILSDHDGSVLSNHAFSLFQLYVPKREAWKAGKKSRLGSGWHNLPCSRAEIIYPNIMVVVRNSPSTLRVCVPATLRWIMAPREKWFGCRVHMYITTVYVQRALREPNTLWYFVGKIKAFISFYRGCNGGRERASVECEWLSLSRLLPLCYLSPFSELQQVNWLR